MKKALPFLLIGALLFAFAYFAFMRVSGRSVTGSLPPVAIPGESITPASPSLFQGSTSSEPISMGTPQGPVIVKNFYSQMEDTEEGMAVLRSKPDYSIFYNIAKSEFSVFIAREPKDAIRKTAEQDLLDSILGVSMEDACKLTIRVQDYSGGSAPLCVTPQ